jgi:putative methyltransferase
LADLAYLSLDEFIHPLPLNVGYIGAYLKQELKNVNITIIKDPEELISVLEDAQEYHVIGLSNYDWNMNLNSNFLRLIKEKYPHIITVMGGPNIDIDSEESLKDIFHSNIGLDFYVIGEGEYNFKRLIQSLIEKRMKTKEIWAIIPQAIIGLDRNKNVLLRGAGKDVGPCDLSTMPSPYLTGLLDKFLGNPLFAPIIETNRGCPFNCAYCYWGSSINSKIREFRLETVFEEIDYASRKTKNPVKLLFVADANFGIFKRDVEIAQILRNAHDKTGFPRSIYIYFYKFTDEKMLRIAELLKELTEISMSKQTLNPKVLQLIGRKNMPDEQYDLLHNKIKEVGMSPYCELIYGLPEETLASFLDGLEEVARSNIKPVLYPLLLIKGTRVNSEYFRKKYEIQSAFRIIPRYTGSYGPINSVEYEELAVSNARFSKEDYLAIRLIHFFYFIFSEKIFMELSKYIQENRLNIVSFLRFLINDRNKWPSLFELLVHGFEVDSKSELIEKKDLKTEFSKEQIEKIKSLGLALNIFYFCKMVTNKKCLTVFKQYLSDALKRYFTANSIAYTDRELLTIVDICFDKIPDFPEIEHVKIRRYNYDVESWLNNNKKFSEYETGETFTYKLHFEKELISLFDEQYLKYNNVGQSLYWFRMNFVANQYLSYTYERSSLQSKQTLAE